MPLYVLLIFGDWLRKFNSNSFLGICYLNRKSDIGKIWEQFLLNSMDGKKSTEKLNVSSPLIHEYYNLGFLRLS